MGRKSKELTSFNDLKKVGLITPSWIRRSSH